MGIRLLARSIEEPLRQIVENAGEDAAVVLNAVKAGKGRVRRALQTPPAGEPAGVGVPAGQAPTNLATASLRELGEALDELVASFRSLREPNR